MAKKESTEAETMPGAMTLEELAGAPATPMEPLAPEQRDDTTDQPFVPPPPPQVPPPTDEQYAWFAANPGYVRISHSLGSYTMRGTLDAEGTFTAEGPGQPVMDGGGSFGVGIPS